mmetsp:Transcript_46038/g.73764  ORF Transcript_46038/g.73764 Transcript_46038/m.73764 type:complete len:87 (-) Transcript_46038:291-551(-)
MEIPLELTEHGTRFQRIDESLPATILLAEDVIPAVSPYAFCGLPGSDEGDAPSTTMKVAVPLLPVIWKHTPHDLAQSDPGSSSVWF